MENKCYPWDKFAFDTAFMKVAAILLKFHEAKISGSFDNHNKIIALT